MGATRITKWAESANGEAIELFHSAGITLAELDRPILFIGGVHGDEPEGIHLADELLSWLKGRQQTLTCPDWIVIPCLNPDGYRNQNRVNGNGTDINRNFPTKNWSAKYEQPRYNPGTAPLSEPESKALDQLIRMTRPRLIIHAHSWQPCIIYTGDAGRPLAEALAACSGYPSKSDIGYATPGSLGEYGYSEHGTPVICIEALEGDDLDKVWGRFSKVLMELFQGIHLERL